MSERSLPVRASSAPLALIAAMLVLIAGVVTGSTARAAMEPSYRNVGDVTVYLGMMPAEIVRGHPQDHAERTMHGGSPNGPHDYHLVVAIFESSSGVRVEDAEVWATIEGLGHIGRKRVKLEPMVIADTTTFGNFFLLPGTDRYEISLEIRRPNESEPVKADFVFRHDTR